MARVIQISDPHLVAQGKLVSGRIDTAAHFRRAVARVAQVMERTGPVDALLVTGDLSDDGSAESYALFREEVAALDLPLYVIPGNHDLREPMRAACADLGHLPQEGRLDWVADLPGMRLVGLDTLVEGQGGGRLERASLDLLERALAEATDPVMIALHHPPFASGIAFMDGIGLENADALAEVLSGHGGPCRVVCGHVHGVMAGTVGVVTAISAPATGSTFDIDFRADAPIGWFEAPGGFLLHDSVPEFRSLHLAADPGPGPHPF